MSSARERSTALGLLTLIYVFNFMDRQLVGVLAEPLKRDLNLSDSQLGLLTGFMFALFYTTFGVPVGWLADRTRRTWVVSGSCALWSLFSAACGLATSFATLAAARIGVAVGEAGGVPPSYSLIADMYPPSSRARALALYSLGVPIGIGIGTATGGWIAAAFGWRTAFFVVSAPGILLALLLLLTVREPRRAAPAEAVAPLSLRAAVTEFVTSPPLMLIALGAAFGGFACYGLMAWIAPYLMRVLGMSLNEVGSWLSITLAVGLGAGIWASGALADRLATRDVRMFAWIPAAALAAGGPVLFAATLIEDWRWALPVFGLALGLSIFYLAPCVAAVQQLVPADRRSTASAMLLLCLNMIGLGGGPLFLGIVSDIGEPAHGTESLRVAFQAMAPMFLIAAVVLLAAARAMAPRRATTSTS